MKIYQPTTYTFEKEHEMTIQTINIDEIERRQQVIQSTKRNWFAKQNFSTSF